MLSRTKKEEIVQKLVKELPFEKAVIFTDYQGLKVKELVGLRKKLFAQGIRFWIAKNTLLKIALKETKINIKEDLLERPLGLAFARDDEVLPAKLIFETTKESEKLEILGGLIEGKFYLPEEIIGLAQLPPREELYGRLVGSLNAPIVRLVGVLQGNLNQLISLLKFRLNELEN